MDTVLGTLDSLRVGASLALSLWWVWLPVVLARVAYDEWFEYQQKKYLAGLKWAMLEVIPPPDVRRSPLSAEQLFASLHASYGGGTAWKSQFFGGKVPDWFSFEIASHGGEMHFYVRCLESHRNTIEALVFSQYPEAEVRPVEDYVSLVPSVPNDEGYDVAGSEFVFTQPPAYPIKNWREFEDAGGKDEDARIDPLAPLFEVMSALRPGEFLWLQYVLRPTGGDWVKEGQKAVDKLMGKEEKPAPEPLIGRILYFPFALAEQILQIVGLLPVVEEKKKEEKPFTMSNLSPAQKNILEQVELKLTKLAFKTSVRALYVARKDAFNAARMAGISGMFKQLFYNNLNTFKPGASTKDKGLFPWLFPNDKGFGAESKTLAKKKAMVGAYRKRTFSKKPASPKESSIILNTEELATLWHLPGLNVKAPLLPRVQAKKGQPPAILPTR